MTSTTVPGWDKRPHGDASSERVPDARLLGNRRAAGYRHTCVCGWRSAIKLHPRDAQRELRNHIAYYTNAQERAFWDDAARLYDTHPYK